MVGPFEMEKKQLVVSPPKKIVPKPKTQRQLLEEELSDLYDRL